MIATWSALAFSIVLGLFGVYSNYESGKSADKKFTKIISTIETSVGEIKSSLVGLKQEPIDYSTSILEVKSKMGSISKELAIISKKELIVKFPEVIAKNEYNKQRNSGAVAPTPVR